MIIISLKDFVTTGKFGPIQIGSTKDEVIKALGKPDFDNDYGIGSRGLMYAWYEFFYWEDSLKIVGIQNDHLTISLENEKNKIEIHQDSICFQNDRISIDIWFLKPGQDITYSEVIDILRTENISFEEITDHYQNHLIKFDSGVTMDFDDLSGVSVGDEQGNFKKYEHIITTKENRVLNGIRLFDQT